MKRCSRPCTSSLHATTASNSGANPRLVVCCCFFGMYGAPQLQDVCPGAPIRSKAAECAHLIPAWSEQTSRVYGRGCSCMRPSSFRLSISSCNALIS